MYWGLLGNSQLFRVPGLIAVVDQAVFDRVHPQYVLESKPVRMRLHGKWEADDLRRDESFDRPLVKVVYQDGRAQLI